jgi:NAD(P)H-dependent FMN reductase
VGSMERTRRETTAALELPDAWQAFTGFVAGCVRDRVGTLGHLAGHYEVSEEVWELGERLGTTLQALIDRTHADGGLRPGMTAADLTELLRALGSVEAPDRFVPVVLDGLRGADPLPGHGRSWDEVARPWRSARSAEPAAEPLRLAMLIGSVREGRFGPTVASWMTEQTRRHGAFELDLIDLAEADLPVRQQAQGVSRGVYPDPRVRAFAARIAAADAYVFITPEYNHGYPAALKLAIDSVMPEWRAKPVALVSYGGISGGLRAIEQLRLVVAELNMVSIRETVSFPMARHAFDQEGQPHDLRAADAARRMLSQLHWWAASLKRSRAEHVFR